MINTNKISSQAFSADQDGINNLKDEFFSEAKEFCYFRKGEWTGIEASIQHAIEWAMENPEWVAIAIATYTPSKDLVSGLAKATGATISRVKKYFTKRKRLTITRRVICSSSTSKTAIKKWEEYCGKGSVITIPKSQIGQFRYILNEKRYAIFSRFGPNDLRGVIGKDKGTIFMLREMFDREFIEAAIRKRNTKKRTPQKA